MVTNTSTALDKLLGYLESDPANPNLLVDCAECCLYSGDQRARTFNSQALAISPDNVRALYIQGMIELSEHAFNDAETIFQQLINQGVNDASIQYNLAYAKLYLLKMEEVVALLTPLVELDIGEPQPPESILVIAKAHYHLGNLDETLKNLERYLTFNSGSDECLGLLALAYGDTGENQELALEYANRALAINPLNHEGNLTLASGELEGFQFESARSQYTAVLEGRPNSGRAWMGMGLTSLGQNDPINAETELQNCVDNMPQHLGSWSALGWAQIVQSKFDEAEITFNKALEINNLFGESHGGLACVYALTGRTEKAKHAAKLGKRLDSDSFSARFAEVLLMNPNEQKKIQSRMTDLLSTNIQGAEDKEVTLVEALNKIPSFGGIVEQLENKSKTDNKTTDKNSLH